MPEQERQQPVVIHTGGGLFARFGWLGWVGFAICGVLLAQVYVARNDYLDTSKGVEERLVSGDADGRDKVAVISLEGMIVDGGGYLKRQIDRVRQDKSVKAVVLRVNSPGGTVYGSDYIYHHLTKLRDERKIPIVVSMGAIAASGGYYAAMTVGEQEDSIFAEPTTLTGSIGVIIPHYDISGLLAEHNVQNDSIASHPRKQMLSMTREMSEEHRAIVQGQVDHMFERFKEIVYAGRPDLRNEDGTLMHDGRDLATGEVFTGVQAEEYGLVDRVGFLEDAIDRAIELADVGDEDKVRVIRYRDTRTSLALPMLIQANAKRSFSAELATLLKMTEPRAYYLAPGYLPLPAE